MSQHASREGPSSGGVSERERLVADLERRIDELEVLGDAELGAFTSLDWFLCVAGCIVLPALALWWFAG
jgi:hypothetical protein